MRYCDTSFLAPLLRSEARSLSVARFVTEAPTGELAVSKWTEVEVASLLAQHVRMGTLGSSEADDAGGLFREIVRRSFIVLSPESEDYELAGRYLRIYETGLRGGDALHLAIAENQRANSVLTLDKGMLKAGRMLGLPMSDGTSMG